MGDHQGWSGRCRPKPSAGRVQPNPGAVQVALGEGELGERGDDRREAVQQRGGPPVEPLATT